MTVSSTLMIIWATQKRKIIMKGSVLLNIFSEGQVNPFWEAGTYLQDLHPPVRANPTLTGDFTVSQKLTLNQKRASTYMICGVENSLVVKIFVPRCVNRI